MSIPLLSLTLILAAAPADEAKKPERRVDAHGNPLPASAIARLGAGRFRGARSCLTFSPDGKRFAATSGPSGENVTIWDVATERRLREIAGTEILIRLAFSPDGKRLAACSHKNRCRVLDVDSGKEVFNLTGTHGCYSADGKVLVTADQGADARVRVWDAATGTEKSQGWRGNAFDLVLADDGQTAAVVDRAGPVAVHVIDLSKGTTLRSFHVAWSGNPQLAMTADGKSLATIDANGVRLWDTADGKMIQQWNGRAGGRIVFSPDGRRLAWVGAAGDKGNAVSVRLATLGRDGTVAIGPLLNHTAAPCFSPDGKLLAIPREATTVSLHEVAGGKEVRSFAAHGSPVLGVAFTPDDAAVISRTSSYSFAWEMRTGALLRRTEMPAWKPGREYVEALLPDGRLLTADRTSNPLNGLFRLRDGRSGEEVWRFEGRPDVGPPVSVAAPGGRFVAVHGRKGEVSVLDARTGKCKYSLDPREAHPGLKLSSDGDVLVWHSRQDKEDVVCVRRQASGKSLFLRGLPKIDRWVFVFDRVPCVSPDGRCLVLSTSEGQIQRWDLTTGEKLSPLADSQRTVWEMFWSSDGRFLATHGSASQHGVIDASAGQDVRVWDAVTGEKLPQLTLPDRGGTTVIFSHDNRTILTTDLEGGIHVWEVATGQERLTVRGHLGGQIGALALSRDDRMLASGGYDTQAFVWDLTGRMADGRWRAAALTPQQRESAWEALERADGRAAYAALWQIVADPDGTAEFLGKHLRPVPRPKKGQVARAIANLDSAEFAVRERAERELEELGESAAAELRQTLARKPSLEVRRRVDSLLQNLAGPPRGRPLQALRAVEALEQIGTPAARDVLHRLAAGAAGARLTQEAQRALQRAKNVERP